MRSEASYMLKEQIEAETIIQMARAKFKQEEVYKNHDRGQITYKFPNGSATIQYDKVVQIKLIYNLIVTTNDHFNFTMQNKLTLLRE